MERKIVRIQKLNDIDRDDWKITFEDEIFITKKHDEFFELVERGLDIRTQRGIKMAERLKAEETSVIFEQDDEVKKLEKEKVKQFREDVNSLSLSQFNKKYPSKKLGEVSNG
jgi:hypothetical protein